MPTYEYECTRCERIFEVFQSITAPVKRSIKTDCKTCNNKAPVRRLIGTGAAILFKGDGFYETDYRSDAYKKAAKAEKESASESPKGDKKSDDSKTKKPDTAAKTDAKKTTKKPKNNDK
jgi:putative FmdB family regulatory protein